MTEPKATTEAIIDHVNAALAYTRRRQPVTRVGRDSRSLRPVCLGCGFGIRLETTPVEGMHPRCLRVAKDEANALVNRPSTVAARVPSDIKRVAADPTLAARMKAEHAELLARFEASEATADEAASA